MTDSIRLSKRVAELRACSRREAELTITGGWVRVDGVVIETPQFRVADQHIEIDAKADLAQAEPVTLLLHKPAGVSMEDVNKPGASLLNAATLGPDTHLRPLKKHFTRLAACVPLETAAAGLVVFTQDWRVARKLTDDLTSLEHEVIVEVAGTMIEDGMKRLSRGIAFRGRVPLGIKVSWQNETHLRVALKGALDGEIPHLCDAVGLSVVAMRRIRLGRVAMGKLPAGQWRYLRENEHF